MMNKKPVIEVKNLHVHYNEGRHNEVRAVEDISFNIYEGETFGLVGESGSGKSTTGRAILKLEDITKGDILFNGKSLKDIKSRKDELAFRKEGQMVFQDPFASLNVRKRVRDIIMGAYKLHNIGSSKQEREAKMYQLLEKVGLNHWYINRYPDQLSGGQAQRVGIARALAVEPSFIIADEAISALDVSIQAQIINLLIELKEDFNLTYLFIAHDLAMVRFISDRVGVMNQGKLLEVAPAEKFYHAPLHPYTESLLSAIPVADPIEERKRKRVTYDYSTQVYDDLDNVGMFEIDEDHFVYCHKDEVDMYKEKNRLLLERFN